MITFSDFVAECLEHVQVGLITEQEMATKIETAAKGELPFCEKPTHDTAALGIKE